MIPEPAQRLLGWPWNTRWTMADMEMIEAMARRRATSSEIAEKLGVERQAIIAVCQRNGINLWSGR